MIQEFWKEFQTTRGSSDKSFGLLFFGVFLLGFLWNWKRTGSFSFTLLTVSLLFLFLALTYAKPLHPLNRAWLLLGMVMGIVMSPIVLGVVFYLVFSPFAFVVRLFRGDRMGLKPRADKKSYWENRNQVEANPELFRQQF